MILYCSLRTSAVASNTETVLWVISRSSLCSQS